MKIVVFVVLALVVAGLLAFGYLRWRGSRPASIESSMREFQRGLEALDPANDHRQQGRDRSRSQRSSGDDIPRRNRR